MSKKILPLIFLIVLSNSLFAQITSSPFSTINVSAGVSKVKLSEPLNSYWLPKYSFVLEAEFPFSVGEVGTCIMFSNFKGQDVKYPDFYSLLILLSWGIKFDLPTNITWFNGGKIGTFQIKFEDEKLKSTAQFESEMCVGLCSKINFSPFDNFNLSLKYDYLFITAVKMIKLQITSIELGYRFSSPKWLREFLK